MLYTHNEYDLILSVAKLFRFSMDWFVLASFYNCTDVINVYKCRYHGDIKSFNMYVLFNVVI